MPVSKDLLLAILSMDAYNRGYDQGLVVEGNFVGAASLSTDSEREFRDPNAPEGTTTRGEAASFYAAAYSMPFGTVISYRGTDEPPSIEGWSLGPDFWNGYGISNATSPSTKGPTLKTGSRSPRA